MWHREADAGLTGTDDGGSMSSMSGGGVGDPARANAPGVSRLVDGAGWFEVLTQFAPVGIFLADPEGANVYTNPTLHEHFGTDSDGTLGMAWLEAVHPDDRELIEERRERGGESRGPHDVECRVRRPDGAERWLRVRARRVHGEGGEVRGYVGTTEDVTERRTDGQRLRQSEEMNRAILETAAEAIVTVDPHGLIKTFNATAEKIFGWDSDDAIGDSIGSLLSEPHREVLLGYLRKLRDTGETTLTDQAVRELSGLHRNGGVIPIEMAVTKVETAGHTVFTGIIRDISERTEMERRLEHQATHDPLTALPNRALLAAQLENALVRAYRTTTSVAVLFVSLDRVKVVTDSLGHRAGDELRVAVARRLQGVVRPTDTVARFGEDEFVILAEDLQHVREAVDLAQHVIESMAVEFDLTVDEAFISCNVGISFAVDGIGTAESLVGDADVAMFRAKERGAGQFEIFDSEMRSWINERRKTEVALRHAIGGQEFELHYQPIVSLPGSSVTGFEALVRWDRRDQGMYLPAEFIPVAEDSGLIIPLGEWILGAACSRLAEIQGNGYPAELSISVNLSGRQLAQHNLADVVDRALSAAGANPEGLVMEITETVLLDDVEQAGRILGELKDIGVQLSIDDFGTGYSSLTHLRQFPIDSVKIDRSFVSELGTDQRDNSIVRTVVLLAEGLGLEVVAEGVETIAQLEALASMGCDYAQGYYFSHPREFDELEILLR